MQPACGTRRHTLCDCTVCRGVRQYRYYGSRLIIISGGPPVPAIVRILTTSAKWLGIVQRQRTCSSGFPGKGITTCQTDTGVSLDWSAIKIVLAFVIVAKHERVNQTVWPDRAVLVLDSTLPPSLCGLAYERLPL